MYVDHVTERGFHLNFFLIFQLPSVLLEKKANPLLRDDSGKTPLHIAAETGKARHVEVLTKSSITCVCQKDLENRTPLHFAALNGKQ